MQKKHNSQHGQHCQDKQNKNTTQTNFRAVKKLVESEIEVATLRNRLKVLQANDNKNQAKIIAQTDIMSKIQSIRKQRNIHLQQLSLTKEERQLILKQLKVKVERDKKEHIQRKHNVMDEIAEQKLRDYLEVCEQREVIQARISENRSKDLFQKQNKRIKVVEREEESRKKYCEFVENKMNSIITQNKYEIQSIHQKRRTKQKQLQKLSELQMQLLKKQSQSRLACQYVRKQLDNMIGLKMPKPANKQQSVHQRNRFLLQSTQSKIY